MLKILLEHYIGWGYCKGFVLSGVGGDFWAQSVVILVLFKSDRLHVDIFWRFFINLRYVL